MRVLGAAYDTTGERGAAARVTRVLEAMPAGFYCLDREWRFTHVNAEAERLLDRSREDLLGRVLWDEFPAAINSIFEDSYRTAVRTGLPISFDAYYPAPLDGWYELRAWPSPDGLSVYFLEVTERRRVQQQAERGRAAAGAAGPRERGARRHARRDDRDLAPPAARRPGARRLLRRHRDRRRRAAPRRRLLARRPRDARRCSTAMPPSRLDAMPGDLAAGPGPDQRRSACTRSCPTWRRRSMPGEASELLRVARAPVGRGAAAARPRPDARPADPLLRRGLAPPTRTTCPRRRTSPTGPAWPSTTPASTAPSRPWPRGCSAAC